MPSTTTQRTPDARQVIWDLLDWVEATGGGVLPIRIIEAAQAVAPGCSLCRGTPGRVGDAECWRCREEAEKRGEFPRFTKAESDELLAACGAEVRDGR